MPWTHLATVRAPFADFTWAHARRLAAERGLDGRDEGVVAAVVNDLLQRAETGPQPTKSDQRVAARTRAATATPMRPATPPSTGAAPTQDDEPDKTPRPDEDGDGALAEVIPFGVFDARLEAERWR